MLIKDVVKKLKEKRILKSLSDEFVKNQVELYFKKNIHARKILEKHPKPLKSKEFKRVLKDLRKRLHEVYGVFILDKKDLSLLKDYLKKTKKIDTEALELHKEILLTHKSTAERFDSYLSVYENIFKITGKPKSILDLACGLNPLSFPWMGLKEVDYFASELTEEDSRFIQDYFDVMKRYSGLNGKAFSMDLLKIKQLPKTDVCFLFKVLDSLEDLERDVSKEILKKIPARFVVVSFPTMSIGGKNPIRQRGWFFRVLRQLGCSAESFEIENEMFYIIKK